MKLLVILSLMLVQDAFAEEIKCSITEGDVPEITTTVSIKPKMPPFSGGVAYLYSDVANDSTDESLKLKDDFMIERLRKADRTVYRDMTSGKLFQLILPKTIEISEDFPGSLILYQGLPYERRYENMTCSFSGDLHPKGSACPKPEELNPALMTAAKQGTPKDIEKLLRCGADVNYKDKPGCTALLYTTNTGCGRPGYHSTHEAIYLKDVILKLIEEGARIDEREPASLRTPLLNLAYYQSVAGIDALLTLKSDVNAQDKNGNTALMLATGYRDELLVRTLLSTEPKLDLKNKEGLTAYALAEKKGYTELLELLIPVAATETIKGNADKTCSPTMVHLYKGKPVEIVLKANQTDMFLLKAPDLGLELMAMPNGVAKKKITPQKTGTFPFECGVHGSSKQTKGSFMVM